MLRNKTEITCDNCGAEIELPAYQHRLTYFGMRDGATKRINATICGRCADELENSFYALFAEQKSLRLNRA